jgi:predicted MPP superfamily phosphohydrolase
MRKMVKKMMDFQPDLILFGGDFLQSILSPKKKYHYLESLAEELAALQAPDGLYSILGNHDYGTPESRADKMVLKLWGWKTAEKIDISARVKKTLGQGAKINFIDNDGLWLKRGGAQIRLGGVGDLWFDKQDLKRAKGNKTDDDFMILLSHQPNYFDQITPEDKGDLVLAGHTHGGQVSLMYYLPVDAQSCFRWRYRGGLVKAAQGQMLVSTGVGNSAPYIRFFAPPKIHLITLRSSVN